MFTSFGIFVHLSYAIILLIAVLIIRHNIKKNGMNDRVNTTSFLVNSIAFILAVIPIIFAYIFYYQWAMNFYNRNNTAENKHTLRNNAIIARWGEELSNFVV